VLIKAMTEGNGTNLKPFDSTTECFMARLDSSFEFLDFRQVTRPSDCDFVWLTFVSIVADSLSLVLGIAMASSYNTLAEFDLWSCHWHWGPFLLLE
jgi:hypothetical protein